MDMQNVWTVATKDFAILRRKRSIIYSIVAFPIGMGIGLSAVVWLVAQRNPTLMFADLFPLFAAFNFFFIIMASSIPVGMASYSIAGEKVEKSLEPLLATPATDGEILLGKSIASFLPSVGATYFGAAIFMVLIDVITYPQLGYLYYPNWNAGVFIFLATPLTCLFSIELSVIVSSRVTDVRTANQFGSLLVIPFAALYVLGEINVIALNANTLLIISAVLLLIDVFLYFVSRSTFRREEILTKWK
jgi:ABC-2 type transport system permease protein